MNTKKLYVLTWNLQDGSFSSVFVIDELVIKLLAKAYEEDLLSSNNDIGVDTDGFHYKSVNIPESFTSEDLGIEVYTLEEAIKNIESAIEESSPEKTKNFWNEFQEENAQFKQNKLKL